MRLEHWLYTLPLRLRSIFRGRSVDRELDEEMQYHMEQLTRQNVAEGMSPEDARLAALRAMDGLEQNKERCRETRGVAILLNAARDVRFAFRGLRKNPGFSLIAFLTLALGIGATTAIFTVVNAILLRPLPFPEPKQLVRIWETRPAEGHHRNVVNGWNFLDWREQTHSFTGMAAVGSMEMNLSGNGDPVAVPALSVSPEYFSILEVPALLGRTLIPADEAPGHDDKVLLSYSLWQERFGGDSQIVGKRLLVNGTPSTVVGVMPSSFTVPETKARMWTPLPITRDKDWGKGRFLTVIARLKPGVTLQQAQQDIVAAAGFAAQQRPDYNHNWSAEVVPLLADLTGDMRQPLWVLLGAVGLLLLIACANVANLVLMRGAGRQREIALCEALGASRKRIMQQLLAEGLLLAFGGMLAGLVLAHFGLRTALALIPQSTPLPRNEPVTLDSHVLAFALLTSLATAIFFCLVPSLRLSRVHLSATLRLASHQNAGSGSRKTRQLLAACELALAVLLCIGAGLMLRSFQRLLSVNPGFNTEHVVTMRIFTSPAKYHDPAKRTQYMEQMLREVRAVPGVEAAGTIHLLPLRELTSRSCFAPGELKTEPNPATSSDAQFLIISPGYFDAMQTTILKGRDFNDSDRIGSRGVIIVNQAFVRSFLPGQDPIGHHFSVCWNTPNPAEIVGVVADARQTKLNKAPEPTIFLPNAQAAMYFASIVARATGDPRQIMNSVVAAVHRIDPEQPVTGMETLETVLSESISQPRFQLVLLGAFGLLALALATIGVYGVISYSVTQRVEEIGIRLALGAQRSTVLNLVLREALALAGLGLAAGLLAALGFTRVISALLYDVSPTDPTTLLVVSSTLLLAALLAAFVPALRATRVDPIHALRSE